MYINIHVLVQFRGLSALDFRMSPTPDILQPGVHHCRNICGRQSSVWHLIWETVMKEEIGGPGGDWLYLLWLVLLFVAFLSIDGGRPSLRGDLGYVTFERLRLRITSSFSALSTKRFMGDSIVFSRSFSQSFKLCLNSSNTLIRDVLSYTGDIHGKEYWKNQKRTP